MKKTISLILLIVTIINILAITSRAEEINSVNLYPKSYSGNLLRWGNINLECYVVVYKKDGIEYPAYCLQRELSGVSESLQYPVSIDKLINNVMVWRTIINGYPYKTIEELGCKTEEEAFMATKQAVYCIIYNRDLNSYTARNEGGERCLNAMKQIVNSAKTSSAIKISSDISIQSQNSKWELDKINKEYIYQIFEVEAEGPMNNYVVELNGEIPEGTRITDLENKEKNTFNKQEKFKIIIPLKNINKEGNFNININGKVNTKPILYGKSENATFQDYALTASVYEEGKGEKNVYYSKNETKIIIVKKEENTENKLENAQFELLDDKQNILYTGLKTNKDGEVQIDNLIPGTYYVKEIKTLDGYQIYDKLIKVDIELNEEITVNVVNAKKEIDIKKETKESEMTVESKKQEVTVKLPKTGM